MTAIGLMGGTFDPIHYGHLILGEQAYEQFELDKVLFVTAAAPPHKADQPVTPAAHRFEMARLAVEGNEHFECSSIEMERAGPSYTVDTVCELLRLYGEDTRIYLLLGADEAVTFMSWRDPYEILKMATIVVANRAGGCSGSDVSAALPADIVRKIVFMNMPGVDISSTDLRMRVQAGRSIKYLVPEKVENYILNQRLYRG